MVVELAECEDELDFLFSHVEVGLAKLFNFKHAAAAVHFDELEVETTVPTLVGTMSMAVMRLIRQQRLRLGRCQLRRCISRCGNTDSS